DLFERVLAAVDPQREPRDVGALRRPDGKALDVVAAPRKGLGVARRRTRLVLEPDADRVSAHATGRLSLPLGKAGLPESLEPPGDVRPFTSAPPVRRGLPSHRRPPRRRGPSGRPSPPDRSERRPPR